MVVDTGVGMFGRNLLLVTSAPGLPPGVQRRLAELHDGPGSLLPQRAAAALAARPDLDGGAAGLMARSSDPTVRSRALRTVPDPGLLEALSRSGVRALSAVAENRHTPAELLSQLSGHADRRVALRALCNPATPEGSRRAVLSDLGRAAGLVAVASPVGAGVVRAGELVANNPWLVERAGELPSALLRGLSGLPSCPREVLERRANRWVPSADHPARQGRVLAKMTLAELEGNSSAAAHMELLSRPSFTAQGAAYILAGARRSGSHTLARDVHPEPHVVARVFRRFGAEPLLHGVPAKMAGTRVSTAAWAEPFVWEALGLFAGRGGPGGVAGDLAAASEAVDLLGEDPAVWSTFVTLAGRHIHEPDRLVEAAEVSLVMAG